MVKRVKHCLRSQHEPQTEINKTTAARTTAPTLQSLTILWLRVWVIEQYVWKQAQNVRCMCVRVFADHADSAEILYINEMIMALKLMRKAPTHKLTQAHLKPHSFAFTQCLRWVVHLPVWFGSIQLKSDEERNRKISTNKEREEKERETTTRDIYECKQEVNMSVFIIIFMVFLWGFLCLQWIFALFDCDKCLYTYNTHTHTRPLCKWYEAWLCLSCTPPYVLVYGIKDKNWAELIHFSLVVIFIIIVNAAFKYVYRTHWNQQSNKNKWIS